MSRIACNSTLPRVAAAVDDFEEFPSVIPNLTQLDPY